MTIAMSKLKKEHNIQDKLFSLGIPKEWGISKKDSWMNYIELGLGQHHIPDLIDVATDTYLLEKEEDPKRNSAPIHAWRALGQLKAIEAIPSMLACFEIYERFGDIGFEELPIVMGMIGEETIDPLYNYLIDCQKSEFSRVMAKAGLEKIALQNASNNEILNTVIQRLTLYLKNATEDTLSLNGLTVIALLDIHKIHPLPEGTIKEIINIYNKEIVDEFDTGDLEDVEIELGVRKERTTPRRQSYLEKMLFANDPEIVTPIKPIVSTKIGRNEPCPCGSGKKYKKCCHQNSTVH